MRESEGSPERGRIETGPELGPGGDTGDGVLIRSDDGLAELTMVRGSDGAYDVQTFRTERSVPGMDSAWEAMDKADAAGGVPPVELSPSLGPHPDYIDLLRDEPASVAFWQERVKETETPAAGDTPEQQEALDVARRMAEDSEHRGEVARFEDPQRWIADVNAPGTDSPGRDYNCVFCGMATEARWRGTPAQAGEWPHDSGLAPETVERLVGPVEATSPAEIDRTLRDAGPGSSGIVVVETVTGGGHMVNVVNDAGSIRWLDGQQATVEPAPPDYATRYRWNARDSEGRRL